MRIYINEIKSLKPLPWLLGVCGMSVLLAGLLSALPESSANMFSGLPDGIKSLLGIDAVLFDSTLGLTGIVMIYAWLVSCMQATLWGMASLTRERRFHTEDFLFSKPVSRVGILAAKAAAAVTGLLATTAAFCVLVLLILEAEGGGFDAKRLFTMLAGYLVVQLMFFSFGLCAAVCIRTVKDPLPFASCAVFGTYVTGALGTALEDERLKYLSPYKYYDPAALFKNGGYQPSMVFVSLLLIAVSFAVSMAVFKRQDMGRSV